jgi:hypothetical protein
MAIGMTYEEYWYGDVLKARAFWEADQERQKRENEKAWLYGVYVCKALEATVGNIGKKRGDTLNEYPQEPIDFDGSRAEERRAQEEERERNRLVAYLNAVAYNMAHKKK